MLAHLRWSLKSSWKSSFRHSSSVFSFSIFPLPCSLWTTMAYDFSNSQNPKPTSKENKPRKQQNQAKIPHKNIKPKRALVPRLTIPSCSNAKINKPKLREPLQCWDRDFWVWVWVWVFALMWWIRGWSTRRKWRNKTRVSKTQVLCGSTRKIVHIRCFPAPELKRLKLNFHMDFRLTLDMPVHRTWVF